MSTVETFTTSIDVVVNDEDREGDERFRLVSVAVTPMLSVSSAVIVILDDDDGEKLLQYSLVHACTCTCTSTCTCRLLIDSFPIWVGPATTKASFF